MMEGGNVNGRETGNEVSHQLESVISLSLDGSSSVTPSILESSQPSLPSQSLFVQVPINGQIFILESKNSLENSKEYFLESNNTYDVRTGTSTEEGQHAFVSGHLVETPSQSEATDFQNLCQEDVIQGSIAEDFPGNLNEDGGSKTSFEVLPMPISSNLVNSVSSGEVTTVTGMTAEEVSSSSRTPLTSVGSKHAMDHDYLTVCKEEIKSKVREEDTFTHDTIEQLYAIYHPLHAGSQKIGQQPMLLLGEAGKFVMVKEGEEGAKNILGDSVATSDNTGLSTNTVLTAETIFRCKKCLQTFPLETIATYHYKTVHLGINDYQCQWCHGVYPGCLRVHMELCDAKPGTDPSNENEPMVDQKRNFEGTSKKGLGKKQRLKSPKNKSY